MKEEGKLTLACMGVAFLAVFALIGGIVSTGIALFVLWGWFIAPIFALPALTIWQAYGIALAFAALRGYREPPKPADDSTSDVVESVGKIFLIVVLHPALLIAIGWIVRSLM